MGLFLASVLALGLLYLLGVYIAQANVKDLAKAIKKTFGVLLCCLGLLVLTLGGRYALMVLPLVGLGLSLLIRWPSKGRANGSAGRGSSVKSTYFDMSLDHETGALNGVVLTGTFKGQQLSDLNEGDLEALYQEVASGADDPDSLSLIEAYLDSVVAGWRENFHANRDTGQGRTPRTGPITEEEAYEILGLSPGASVDLIRGAHRRLMMKFHPDRGGSTLLAAKINEAKDVLLRNHGVGS